MVKGEDYQMKRRLCIGTINESHSLISILECIGVEFRSVDFKQNLVSSYSVIIIEERAAFSLESKTLIQNYIDNGGAVLEISLHPKFSNTERRVKKFKKSLINSSKENVFKSIPYLDIYTLCSTSEKATGFFEGLITFEKKSAGLLGLIGINLDIAWNNYKYTRKLFFGFGKKSADETVSQLDRHSLIEVIKNSLKYLHFEQGLPFIRKWTSPTRKPVFGFRVDSDYGTKESMDRLYNLADNKGLSLTWFLHVQAHENWLSHFRKYQNQEIALHGYSHTSFETKPEIVADISKGNELLNKAGFEAKGFCAPYGTWNIHLEKALRSFSFDYTSEFTLVYEGYPISIGSNPTQIPIHPICTGSMSRKGYSSEDMIHYFEKVMTNKMSLYEPVLLYHHPLQPGLEAIEYIFKRAASEKLENLTFLEFADFWKKRKDVSFKSFFENEILEIENSSDYNILFEVSNSFKGFDLINSSAFKFEKNPAFKYQRPSLPSPNEIKSLKKNTFRLFKTSMLDWLNRKRS